MRSWYLIALCMTAICIGVPLSANSMLLFHLDGASAILFSALFFGGFGCGTVIGGRCADRYPPVWILFVSCSGVTLASIALPLWSSPGWILLCRFLLGWWAGSVFVGGARLVSLHPRALLSQGVYGGALQLGAGLGVLLTPILLSWWQTQGVLFFWAAGSLVPIALWGMLAEANGAPSEHQTPLLAGHLSAALRLPLLWKLGMVHAGTFGLGTGIAVWVTAYLAGRYHLPLVVAAALGSGYVLAGVFFRPLGGVLVQFARSQLPQIIQLAVILSTLGVALLIIAPTLPVALGGTGLLAVGMNLPYASVLTLAARVGASSGVGAGSAQGAVVMVLCLGLILMPILIGMGMRMGQPFTLSGLLFGGLALTSAWTFYQHSNQRQDNLLSTHPSFRAQEEGTHV